MQTIYWRGPAILLSVLFFCFNSHAQVSGETCETAIVITAPSITDGNNLFANDDYNEACPYTNVNGRDMVYEFTPDFSGIYDVSLCTGLTNFDTKLYIYADSCPAPGTGISAQNLACSDDECYNGEVYPHEWVSEIADLFMAAGTTYYIVVDGYDGFCFGDYSLSLMPDFTFPNSNDIKIVEGRCYNYTEIPFFNIQPTKFEVTLENQGFTDADSAYVVMDIFRKESLYSTTIFKDSSDYAAVQAMTSKEVYGRNFWFPPDTGEFIFRYTLKWEGLPDDTISNDTLYSTLYINQNVQRTNYSGLPISNSLSLPGGGSLSEYGVAFRLHKDIELEAVLIDIETKTVGIGEAVTATVYRALPSVDTLELVASSIAMDLADTGQVRYVVPISEKLESGTYVLTYEGSNAILFSKHISTDGVSNLARHPYLTAGEWTTPPEGLAFSIGLQGSLPSMDTAVCSVDSAPQNFTAINTAATLELSWDAVPLSIGCRVRAGVPGSSLPKRFNVFTFEANSISIPNSSFPPTLFEFAVRCACSVGPPVTTPLSDHVIVDFSLLKLGAASTFAIFPNPAAAQLYYSYEGIAVAESNLSRMVSVVDLAGKTLIEQSQIFHQGKQTNSIGIELLPSGSYVLQIEGMESQPFVVID